MIRKLRRKFIASAMLSLFIVLAVLVGAMNLVNYRSVVRDADETLSTLSENRGRFPGWMTGEHLEEKELSGEEDWYLPDRPAFEEGRRPRQSAELPFESRYFSVILDSDGSAVETDTEHIAAVDGASAETMAAEVAASGKSTGFSGVYRFRVTELDNGVRVTFLDCTRSLENVRVFLVGSVLVSLAGLAAAFGLMLLFSGRVTRPIEESYEKQKQFITDAGHEIKTPLTVIEADAELLAMDAPDNEWLSDIRAQTRRLTELTNDLIFLSRMDEAQTIQRLDFPISDMVSETAASFRSRAIRENKAFIVEVEPMLTCCGDEKALRQLVGILVDNAVKYSPPEGEIRLRLAEAGKNLVLTVSNTCESIPEGDLNHLFERFYRSERSRNSATGGHGLGLSIARAVTAAHKGRISVSAPGGNTMCFEVVLPKGNG